MNINFNELKAKLSKENLKHYFSKENIKDIISKKSDPYEEAEAKVERTKLGIICAIIEIVHLFGGTLLVALVDYINAPAFIQYLFVAFLIIGYVGLAAISDYLSTGSFFGFIKTSYRIAKWFFGHSLFLIDGLFMGFLAFMITLPVNIMPPCNILPCIYYYIKAHKEVNEYGCKTLTNNQE